MPEQLWFTEFLNRHLAGLVTALLNSLPPAFHPRYPQAPISNAFAMEILVFLFLVAVFILIRTRLSVERPGGPQHLAEMLYGFIDNQSHEIIGHGHERF